MAPPTIAMLVHFGPSYYSLPSPAVVSSCLINTFNKLADSLFRDASHTHRSSIVS